MKKVYPYRLPRQVIRFAWDLSLSELNHCAVDEERVRRSRRSSHSIVSVEPLTLLLADGIDLMPSKACLEEWFLPVVARKRRGFRTGYPTHSTLYARNTMEALPRFAMIHTNPAGS